MICKMGILAKCLSNFIQQYFSFVLLQLFPMSLLLDAILNTLIQYLVHYIVHWVKWANFVSNARFMDPKPVPTAAQNGIKCKIHSNYFAQIMSWINRCKFIHKFTSITGFVPRRYFPLRKILFRIVDFMINTNGKPSMQCIVIGFFPR